MLPIQRLEKYTVKHPQEVLIITAQIDGEEDQIAIFKGFSSSLMRPTAFDPDIPVLPENAVITQIDRVANPYNPSDPKYLEQAINWTEMERRLLQIGI